MNARIQRLVALASGIALLPLCAFADTARIEPGHSAIWGDPGRDSEGWIVEILPDDTAALYWYTFDDAGKPRTVKWQAYETQSEQGKLDFNKPLVPVPHEGLGERAWCARHQPIQCSRSP